MIHIIDILRTSVLGSILVGIYFLIGIFLVKDAFFGFSFFSSSFQLGLMALPWSIFLEDVPFAELLYLVTIPINFIIFFYLGVGLEKLFKMIIRLII